MLGTCGGHCRGSDHGQSKHCSQWRAPGAEPGDPRYVRLTSSCNPKRRGACLPPDRPDVECFGIPRSARLGICFPHQFNAPNPSSTDRFALIDGWHAPKKEARCHPWISVASNQEGVDLLPRRAARGRAPRPLQRFCPEAGLGVARRRLRAEPHRWHAGGQPVCGRSDSDRSALRFVPPCVLEVPRKSATSLLTVNDDTAASAVATYQENTEFGTPRATQRVRPGASRSTADG